MILKATGLCKSFLSPTPFSVFEGIDLEIDQGESIAIIGKSGEGKSTLLNILGTLDTPSSGDLSICGITPTPQNVSDLRNQKIGFVFQFYHLLDEFTALENVLMPMRIGRKNKKASLCKAHALLEEVGLEHRAHTLAKLLSGGEKQRVAIARALSNDPELVLADEPTGNLDQDHSEQIQQILLNVVNTHKKALIVVTHDEEFASKCDRTLTLQKGSLIETPVFATL